MIVCIGGYDDVTYAAECFPIMCIWFSDAQAYVSGCLWGELYTIVRRRKNVFASRIHCNPGSATERVRGWNDWNRPTRDLYNTPTMQRLSLRLDVPCRQIH